MATNNDQQQAKVSKLMPFVDENYTVADREQELALLAMLLQDKLKNVYMEQAYLRQQYQVKSGDGVTSVPGTCTESGSADDVQ